MEEWRADLLEIRRWGYLFVIRYPLKNSPIINCLTIL